MLAVRSAPHSPRTLVASAIAVVLLSVSCGAGPIPSSIGPFESDATQAAVRVSEHPDRRHARALNGATLRGEVYIFFDNEADPSQVAFAMPSVDPPVQTTERSAPFDLMGGADDAANAFDTRLLRDGTHELVVEVLTASGGTVRYVATFETRNGSGDVLPGDIFVSPNGSDSGDGSPGRPLRSIQAAIDRSGPGDTIYLREGVHLPLSTIEIGHSGTERRPIRLLAYPGETPIVDGSEFTEEKPILRMRASYWVVKGLEVRNGPDFGIFLEYARNNHFEDLVAHHNGHSGFHLEHHASWNTFVRVDAFANYDPESGGQHADGFAVKRQTATGNVFLEARAWNNSDDGFDLLESSPQRIDRSAAFRNGYQLDGDPYPNGNGNGFKLGIGRGRWEPGGGHVITRSVAWQNETWGFNSNNGTIPITVANNTAWGNGFANYQFNKAEHVLINNLSFDGNVYLDDESDATRNSWQLGIDDPSFVSLDPSEPGFLRLSAGSAAVDEGVDIGLEFAGSSPDLGAFERFD